MSKPLTCIIAATLALCACTGPETLYSWHDYDNATYKYNKRQTEELQAKLLDTYRRMTEHQGGRRGVVPPGLYAEYGYLLYKTGKKDEGLGFLRQEIKLYPESERYISRIIKQIEGK